ncbi:ATP-binding protein [Allokutzneria albata]|uniref:Non-specific serine/threonine protein kinase n=1 Tax=Allokutzneria albata TaxID=211114 RepID=A0A1G9SD06_ALLAB|nr:LuxR C-terminal-related transcriptional regulator [Allokutzneria albata]SDM33344.1 non-specific serine/threonine protein kinase [Allokutzneria albata]
MSVHAGALPAEVSSFVDRRQELNELRRLLGAARLVTVTGVGGVGKTRLALRAAVEVRKGFADGVWWVELSALRDAELLPHLMAEALGLQDTTLRSMEEVLTDFLAARRALLVLDTCEHLIGPCAVLVDRLLVAAPGVRVLATSRQPLGAIGEHVFPVSPLRVWQHGHAGLAAGVELFVERAQAASGAFALTERNREAVVGLCQRLDGLPLAIELAAVRIRALSVQEVLDRLDDRFRLLSGRRHVGHARHETLRTAIGWSYELCTPAERLLWARASVFAGSFDLGGAEAVCTDSQLPAGSVQGLVVGLVEKSILLREDHPSGVRYRLLDTLRAYGGELLGEVGEQGAVRRRHRDHYLRLAQRCADQWCGPDQLAWCARLRRDHANLRAALEFCLDDPAEHKAGLELATALRFLWISTGFMREGRLYLDRVLALDPEPGPVLTTALWSCAWMSLAHGDFAAVDARLAECRPHAERQGDTSAAGWAAYVAGAAAMLRGDPRQAMALAEQGVELHRNGGDSGFGLLTALILQPMVLALTGESDRAVAVVEEARRLCDQHGEQWMRSYADYMCAVAELGRGDPDAAVINGRSALRFKRLFGDSPGIAMSLDLLASAAAAQGQAERAARLLGIAHQVWQTFGLPQLGAPDLLVARRQCERTARQALGDTAYREAFDAGHALDLDAALAYALDERPGQAALSPQSLGWAPLTQRERQVAELVAEGLTNQQIADRLVIAKRTADAHLGHILAKLGLDTRSQIATWVIQRRPSNADRH